MEGHVAIMKLMLECANFSKLHAKDQVRIYNTDTY
jgi:hypothetical protein